MSLIIFYAVAVLLCLGAMLPLAVVWRGARSERSGDHVRNAQIVKQRLGELDREVAEGLISANDKEQAAKELKLALIDESNSVSGKQHYHRTVAIVFVGIALAIGGIVYVSVNNIQRVKQLVDARESLGELSQKLLTVVEEGAEISPQELQSLTLAIRQRLTQTPDDSQAWLNLARLYSAIGFSEQSIAAYERAYTISPDDSTMRLSYAQALMVSGIDENLQRAEKLLQFELAQQPTNDNVALMLTVVAAQLGKVAQAEQYFAEIEDKMAKDSQMYQSIVQRISELKGEDSENSSQGAVETVTGFNIQITADPMLKSRFPADATLFVFARDALTDRPMPAAAIKLSSVILPLTVELTRANAMMPTYTLEQLTDVEIVARMSLDDNVELSAGDWQGFTTATVTPNALVEVQIKIDQETP